MLSLSRKTDYALLILTVLAQRPREFTSLRLLAKEKRLPRRFIAHVVRPLLARGILESREGVAGGYRLKKAASAITVQEVVAAEEGGVALASCLNPAKEYACSQKAVCTVRGGLPLVQRLMLETLARHTIADLLRTHSFHSAGRVGTRLAEERNGSSAVQRSRR